MRRIGFGCVPEDRTYYGHIQTCLNHLQDLRQEPYSVNVVDSVSECLAPNMLVNSAQLQRDMKSLYPKHEEYAFMIDYATQIIRTLRAESGRENEGNVYITDYMDIFTPSELLADWKQRAHRLAMICCYALIPLPLMSVAEIELDRAQSFVRSLEILSAIMPEKVVMDNIHQQGLMVKHLEMYIRTTQRR